VAPLPPVYCGDTDAGVATAIVISLLKCSWNNRVAVTASPASTFFRMTFADITAISATDKSSMHATVSVTSTSTRVNPRRRRIRNADWIVSAIIVNVPTVHAATGVSPLTGGYRPRIAKRWSVNQI